MYGVPTTVAARPPDMKLASVRIKNFRSIKDIEVDFDPACRVLVGINESGKTNILKALHLMRQSNGPDRKEDLREALPDEEPIKEAYVRFRFNFDKTDSDRIFAIVSTQILSASKNPIMSLTGKKRELKQVCADSEYGQYNVNILEEKKRFQYFGFDESFELLDGWQKTYENVP